MQDEDFPLGIAAFKLFLEPTALRPQVEELTVAVQHKKLHIAIVQGIDHVVIDLGVKEIGEHEGETTLQTTDNALEIVVVARHVENRHALPNAVEVAECLCPILVGRSLCQVAPAHEKLHLGMA